MKNTKVKIISTIVVTLLATLLFCANSFAAVKINFPLQITNGTGTINVSGNDNNDKIYYQSIVMTDAQYQNIVAIDQEAETAYNNYRARLDEKNAIYEPLAAKVNAGTATDEEYQQAVQLKEELEAMTSEYESTRDSLKQRFDAAHPQYNNSNWVEAANGKFTISNKTSEDKYYVLWAKVGDAIDKIVYKVLGKADSTIPVKSITLEKGKTVELTGSTGTDLSTITWISDDPTIATMEGNKVKGLKVGATTIRGKKNGKEVIDLAITVIAATSPSSTLDIPDDAKTFEGHSYYYFSGNKSWDDAKAYCEKIGGHLVTITKKEEADFVKTLNGTKKAWIGGYRTTDSSSDWKWVTEESWNYTDWNTSEPAAGNRAALVSDKWGAVDNNSTEITGFICEWDTVVGSDTKIPVDIPTDPTDPTQPTNPSNPTDPSNPGQTKEPEEQLIYRQDGIQDSTTNPKTTSGDQTIATKKIPQTGESIVSLVALVVVAGVSVVLFVNYRKNK